MDAEAEAELFRQAESDRAKLQLETFVQAFGADSPEINANTVRDRSCLGCLMNRPPTVQSDTITAEPVFYLIDLFSGFLLQVTFGEVTVQQNGGTFALRLVFVVEVSTTSLEDDDDGADSSTPTPTPTPNSGRRMLLEMASSSPGRHLLQATSLSAKVDGVLAGLVRASPPSGSLCPPTRNANAVSCLVHYGSLWA